MGACPNIKGKLMGFDHMVSVFCGTADPILSFMWLEIRRNCRLLALCPFPSHVRWLWRTSGKYDVERGSFIVVRQVPPPAHPFSLLTVRVPLPTCSYDGQAPKVFWWAAPSCKPADIVSKGYRISNTQVTMAYSGSTYSVKLNKPVRRAGCIILYCEDFNADLGHLVVKKSGWCAMLSSTLFSNPCFSIYLRFLVIHRSMVDCYQDMYIFFIIENCQAAIKKM